MLAYPIGYGGDRDSAAQRPPNSADLTKGQAMELEGRRIVITGGAGVIARATARLLLQAGATLLLIDPDATALTALTDDLAAGGTRHHP